MQGFKSDPPPNHQACGVQNMRVFMCRAGAWGFCICATRLMPDAQNRGSRSMPGTPRAAIARCAASPKTPWTVDVFTPTFSKTRPPRITDIRPPPASDPSSDVRRVSVLSNRPAGRSAVGPVVWASSNLSNAATIVSRRVSNHALACAFSVSIMSVIWPLPRCYCISS